MSKPFVLYIGDEFTATLIYKADGVTPTPLTNDIVISSSIKDFFGERVDLVITKAPNQGANPGMFSVVGEGTSIFKPGKGAMDVKYAVSGITKHTSKFYFEIERGVTP